MLRDRRASTVTVIALSLGLLISGCSLDAGQRENVQAIGTPTLRTYEAYLASRRWTGPIPTQAVDDQDVLSAIAVGNAPAKQVVEMSISEEVSEDRSTVKLRIQSGEHEYVLGEEGGTAKPGAKGARSFAWFFLCESCNNLEGGLYVLDLQKGTQTHVATRAENILGSVFVAEPWVVYFAYGEQYALDALTLQAHNLETGEDFTLDPEPPFEMRGPSGDIALNEGAVAWEGKNPNGPGWAVHWVDLDTRDKRVVVVERDLGAAHELTVSKSLLLWIDGYWRVCDTRTGQIFALPLLPAGSGDLKNVSMTYPVVSGNRVYWSIEANGFNEDFTVHLEP